MLLVQILDLLPVEVGQVVKFENIQDSLQSSIEKLSLDALLLELFDLLLG